MAVEDVDRLIMAQTIMRDMAETGTPIELNTVLGKIDEFRTARDKAQPVGENFLFTAVLGLSLPRPPSTRKKN